MPVVAFPGVPRALMNNILCVIFSDEYFTGLSKEWPLHHLTEAVPKCVH